MQTKLAEKFTEEVLSYTIPGAARALTLSERSIYRLMDEGTLRRVRRGRRTLIPASDVRALAEGEVS